MKSALNWFEIPVTDMKRAVGFYEAMLGVTLKEEPFNGVPHAIFPYEVGGGVGGTLIADGKRTPGAVGTIVYLPAKDGVVACATRAQKAGGTVLAERIDLGDIGEIAVVRDLEGNEVGLHAPRR